MTDDSDYKKILRVKEIESGSEQCQYGGIRLDDGYTSLTLCTLPWDNNNGNNKTLVDKSLVKRVNSNGVNNIQNNVNNGYPECRSKYTNIAPPTTFDIDKVQMAQQRRFIPALTPFTSVIPITYTTLTGNQGVNTSVNRGVNNNNNNANMSNGNKNNNDITRAVNNSMNNDIIETSSSSSNNGGNVSYNPNYNPNYNSMATAGSCSSCLKRSTCICGGRNRYCLSCAQTGRRSNCSSCSLHRL